MPTRTGSAPMDVNGAERRGFRRSDIRYPVKIEVEPSTEAQGITEPAIHGITVDVSRGGLAAHVSDEIRIGARCIVRFLDAGDRVVPDMTWGVVRRFAPAQPLSFVGIEFETPLETLKLPARAEESDEDRSRRVLVVDDEGPIRDLLAEFLSRRGYRVRTAADGQKALEALQESVPDVLLLDLYMPKLNGLELLRRMREEELAVGIVCTMSGYTDDESALESFRLGADDFIGKPIDLDRLERGLRLRLSARRG